MLIKIEIEGLDEVKDFLGAGFLARLDRNIQEAIKDSGQKVEVDAVDLAAGAVYKGEFMEKISAEFPDPYTAKVGSSAPHAPYVELDTRPHFPPIKPMIKYAHLKLGLPYGKALGKRVGFRYLRKEETAEQVGFLLARKISKVGTKGQHILERAGTQNEETIKNIFIKSVGDAIYGK